MRIIGRFRRIIDWVFFSCGLNCRLRNTFSDNFNPFQRKIRNTYVRLHQHRLGNHRRAVDNDGTNQNIVIFKQPITIQFFSYNQGGTVSLKKKSAAVDKPQCLKHFGVCLTTCSRGWAHIADWPCAWALSVCVLTESRDSERYYTRYNPQTDNCPGMPKTATRACIETTDLFEADG